jgi:uncharacterized protein (DUF427 family)
MPKAMWNGAVLAESDATEMADGNHYFPPAALNTQYFQPSDTTSVCGWKGTAHYYHIVVDGAVNADAAWYYADPKPQAQHLAGRIAFWKGVQVVEG